MIFLPLPHGQEELRSRPFIFGSDLWALFGEERVSHDAALQAEAFIQALPEGLPLPEYACEPGGSISLDWIQSRDRVLSLSIGEGHRLPYAWLDGAESGRAVADFDGKTAPPEILAGIRRIMA